MADVLPFRFVPPVWFRNCFICTRISSDGAHDSKTVLVNDLLHQLNSFQISEHVSRRSSRYETWEEKQIFLPNRAYSIGIFNHFSNGITIVDLVFRTSRDRLFYEHGYARKVLENLQFNVSSRFC